MTPFTSFQPGAELCCDSCELQCRGRFDEMTCQVVLEVALSGEPLTISQCPETQEAVA
jgi:hypothetical protein